MNKEVIMQALEIMGKGMLGIFIVTAIIVVFVNALNNLPDKESEE